MAGSKMWTYCRADPKEDANMLAVRGIYDGRVARPLEEVGVPPNVDVIITFLAEQPAESTGIGGKARRLAALAGAWEGKPLSRAPQEAHEKREALQ